MAVYAVLEPPAQSGSATEHAARFVFLRDGFSFVAFLFAPFWMLWHMMLTTFFAYVFVASVLVIALRAIGASVDVQSLAFVLLNVLVGFEGANWRRAALVDRGWRDRGIVAGDYLEAAERRFFASWTANAVTNAGASPTLLPSPRPDAAPMAPPRLRMPQTPDVVGLFPKPGANR